MKLHITTDDGEVLVSEELETDLPSARWQATEAVEEATRIMRARSTAGDDRPAFGSDPSGFTRV